MSFVERNGGRIECCKLYWSKNQMDLISSDICLIKITKNSYHSLISEYFSLARAPQAECRCTSQVSDEFDVSPLAIYVYQRYSSWKLYKISFLLVHVIPPVGDDICYDTFLSLTMYCTSSSCLSINAAIKEWIYNNGICIGCRFICC